MLTARIKKDESNERIGFVCMKHHEAAKNAVEELNNSYFIGFFNVLLVIVFQTCNFTYIVTIKFMVENVV